MLIWCLGSLAQQDAQSRFLSWHNIFPDLLIVYRLMWLSPQQFRPDCFILCPSLCLDDTFVLTGQARCKINVSKTFLCLPISYVLWSFRNCLPKPWCPISCFPAQVHVCPGYFMNLSHEPVTSVLRHHLSCLRIEIDKPFAAMQSWNH